MSVRSIDNLGAGPVSASRLRLYETAIELFGRRGFHAVSVRELADALGIKPPSLYAHVASKQDLLFQITVVGETLHRDAVKEALLSSGPDPREQVRAIVRAHVLVHLGHPDLARLINTELRHLTAEQVEHIHAIRAGTAQRFLDVIDRGIRLGVFRAADPRRALRAIGDMGVHTAEWDDRPDAAEHEEIARDYAEMALLILRAG
jgi:AcrR family transcriptional regulator